MLSLLSAVTEQCIVAPRVSALRCSHQEHCCLRRRADPLSVCPSCLLLFSLFVLQEQYGFAAKMRNQAVEQLKALETWVERQATGLDMAANPESLRQSFDKLLKV